MAATLKTANAKIKHLQRVKHSFQLAHLRSLDSNLTKHALGDCFFQTFLGVGAQTTVCGWRRKAHAAVEEAVLQHPDLFPSLSAAQYATSLGNLLVCGLPVALEFVHTILQCWEIEYHLHLPKFESDDPMNSLAGQAELYFPGITLTTLPPGPWPTLAAVEGTLGKRGGHVVHAGYFYSATSAVVAGHFCELKEVIPVVTDDDQMGNDDFGNDVSSPPCKTYVSVTSPTLTI
jgi:hypothetical protein